MDEEISMRMLAAALAALLFAHTAHAQGKLRITFPANGTVVHPGDTVRVSVEATGGRFQAVVLIGEGPLDFGNQPINQQPPHQFAFRILANTQPGRYHVTAMGTTEPGKGASSDPLLLDVEPPRSFVKLRAHPRSLEMDVDERTVVSLVGDYADGSHLALNRSTQTTFLSEAPDIVRVSEEGLANALRPGSTAILVNGQLKIFPDQATIHASQTYELSARLRRNSTRP